MLMQEKNNLQIADWIIDWIGESKGKNERHCFTRTQGVGFGRHPFTLYLIGTQRGHCAKVTMERLNACCYN